MAVTKIHPIKSTLKKALDYIENPAKTDEKMLVSSFACAYETADIEFELLLSQAMTIFDRLQNKSDIQTLKTECYCLLAECHMSLALHGKSELELAAQKALELLDYVSDITWICPYISRHLLSLNPLLACCRRYSRGER